MKTVCFLLTIFLSLSTRAATVDTVDVYSNSMHRHVKTVVIRPASYYSAKEQRFPVLYLLHGAFGSYANWVRKVPHIQQLADQYGMMIVCPDGGYTSWYFDSPIDSNYRFETFVATEVPQYIDQHYRTINNRKGRAITGLSMGGHGSIFLAFRHTETFSACGSMSGALHITVTSKGYDLDKRLGDTVTNKSYWIDWSTLNAIEKYPKDSLSILIDCGTEDKVLPMNRAVHEKMLALKIPHEYTERPGEHNWAYWTNAIDHHALFFRKHFDRVGSGEW